MIDLDLGDIRSGMQWMTWKWMSVDDVEPNFNLVQTYKKAT